MSSNNPTSGNRALEGCIGLFRGPNGASLQGENQAHRQYPPQSYAKVPGVDHTVPTPNEMDRIIAKEMTDLSLQEREKAENDVHGIGTDGEEDPLHLQAGLLHMQRHLETMKHGTVYEEAEQMNSNYVNDRDFRLMFLRADRYDPKEAAERMIRFFDLKKSLFGASKLCKTITLDDLDEDDMETLRSGYLQLSPHKDMAGRTILVGMMKLRKMKAVLNVSRVAYYIHMVAIESVDAQKRGIVCVYYLLDATNFSSVTGKLRSVIPVHIVSLHMCYNDITQYAVTCMGIYALNQKTKVRFRPHFGSHIECQYALSTFGIPRQALPVTTSGEMPLYQHLAWIESRRRYETDMILFQSIGENGADVVGSNGDMDPGPRVSWTSEEPLHHGIMNSEIGSGHILIQPNDVLFGRGKTVVEHPGNLKFRNIVGMQMDEYEAASRMEKTSMTEKIVQMVKESDGRFLKRDDGGDWEEVDQETARRKVAHAFRNRRKFNGMMF